ncbi:Negative regulator of mitotic exit [Entomortierella lignicola]|nr:Negative regulator of mitotic exit [Entomortierella lignicola]
MAGLFSKKNKKGHDDSSIASGGSRNQSANNSVSYSPSDYSNPSPYQSQGQYQNSTNGPSAYSSKSSLHQYQSYNGNGHSATSLSTHQSTFNAAGPWSSGSLMSANPFPRFSHTASYVTTGNDIYIFGGNLKGSPQKDVHVIDTQSLHCQLLPVGGDGPSGITGHSAVTVGQYIAYFGGKDAKGKTSDSLYILHTGRKEWNKPLIQTMQPAPRHSHAACIIGTVMYIIGGQYSGYYLNDISSFDMKSLNGKHPKWSILEPKSSLPPARAGHCAAAYEGKLYIFGGADDKYYYNDIWCYDPQTNKWEAVSAFGTLPASRQGHTATVIGDTMYVYGGMNFEDQLLGDLCAFKFTEHRWKTFAITAESPSPRTEHAMCCVGNKIYILGGQLDLNANDNPSSVYVLDTNKIIWNENAVNESHKPVYDDDNLHNANGGYDGRGSPYSHSTPTSDFPRHQNVNDQNVGYKHDSRRETLQIPQHHHHQQHQHQQHQQQRSFTGAIEMNGSRTGLGITDGSQQPINGNFSRSHQIDDEFNDNTYVARRRTMGRPAGYVVQDLENQHSSHPTDEGRRAASSSDFYSTSGYSESEDRQYSQVQPQQYKQNGERPSLYNAPENGSSANVQDGSSSNLAYRSNTPLRHQLSNHELSHQGSSASLGVVENQSRQRSPSDNIRRQSSMVETGSHHSRNAGNSISPVPSKTSTSELKDLKQREQWLLAEMTMARKKMGDRPLSMAILALEDELEACDIDSEKYRITQALLNVKSELERSKTSIATQAQTASNKVREAERIRTSALQETAYLKAKVEALQTGDTTALIATETARVSDLEKRLATALAQLDQYESQFVQYETILEHEKESRIAAEAREKEASSMAEEAQLAHTRAMNDLSSLHERATIAEASLRDIAAKSATSEAGLSSYQQQSAALLSQISTLKTTVDHQKRSLDKAKLAYTVASERAEQTDNLWTESRREMDQIQLELAEVRSNMDRAQREADHWRTKASETELLWQKAKKENEVMRTLLEEDMNAAHPTSKERKHDSIFAITSASRHAELEHELITLRQLLKDSQDAVAQANKDLGDTMVRISQLEQTSMAARSEAAAAQRHLKEAKERVAMLQTQLLQKEETIAELVRNQDNSEAQLSMLRVSMKELEEEHSQCSGSNGLRKKQSDSAADLENEVADLHQQLHAAHQHSMDLESQVESLSTQLQRAESQSEVSQIELQSLKAQKRGGNVSEQTQLRVEQLEKSLAETKHKLDQTLDDLDHANELNRVTGQELEDALDALKKTNNGPLSDNKLKRQEELESTIESAQRTIQSLRQTNLELEEQLKASENKISLLLDNYQAPESVRDSVASFSGLTSGLLSLNDFGPSSPPARSHMDSSSSHRSHSTSPTYSKQSSRSMNGGLTSSQKLEEYEKMIDEMTNARRQYED